MNNTMVREMRGAKINPKSSFKNEGAQNMRGAEITRANTVYHLRKETRAPTYHG
jgi:hypothetical protein